LGQGYVRVVEQSIMWRETETVKVFTYQGLTTCTELDKSWTIMSSIYNHLRQGRDKSISELKFFIRAEVELQERLETSRSLCHCSVAGNGGLCSMSMLLLLSPSHCAPQCPSEADCLVPIVIADPVVPHWAVVAGMFGILLAPGFHSAQVLVL
jgi:hypothetical protein